MRNYDLLLLLLKKWPIDSSRGTRDFGFHLRQLSKNGFPSGNIFKASESENRKMLKSLLRLAENKYNEQYPFKKQVASSGFTAEKLKKNLSDEYIDKMNLRG